MAREPKWQKRPRLEPRYPDGEPGDSTLYVSNSHFVRFRPFTLPAIGVALATLLVSAFAGLAWVKNSASPLQPDERNPDDRAIPDVAMCKAFVLRFFRAESLEERLGMVRNPGRARERMERFYQSGSDQNLPPILRFGDGVAETQTENADFVWLNIQLENAVWRTAVVEKQVDGQLALDWETLVLYQDMQWARFLRVPAEQEQAGTFRVYARAASYYNFQFADSELHSSYRLEDPGRTGECWAYADIDSEVDAELKRLTSPPFRPEVQVVLMLRSTSDESGNFNGMARIEEVVSDSWFVP